MTTLNPYLNFRDNTREVMEFYKRVFGGELTMSTYKDFHASEDPSEDEKIMHAKLVTASGLVLMAADTPKSMEYHTGTDMSLTLNGENEDEAELRGYYDKLSAGGHVMMPLEKAQWGDTFGMFADKFGVKWMVNIAQLKA